MSIARLNVHVFRAPTPAPVATSFGVMRDRPAVFVRVEDSDGAFGWGEIFANWPIAGAEHRARLLIEDIADLVLGQAGDDPQRLWRDLTDRTETRALQCGEWGPFRQVLAGLDTALCDMAARRAGVPLARWLSGGASASVPVYASGLHVSRAVEAIEASRAQGIEAFKVKIGFDEERDMTDLRMLIDGLGPQERLFADANQSWTLEAALRFAAQAEGLPLGWLEEPIRADRPAQEWETLAEACKIPLAAGENITGFEVFGEIIEGKTLAFIQPDLAKWGGVSGCFSVACQTVKAGLTYCPHFLGGGIGLSTSAHVLAAAGGAGLLELDVNTNPLRDAFFAGGPVCNGVFAIPDMPGLGIDALPEEIEPFRTLELDISG